jgi:D-alanyl-D-alanine carboxypeptidase
MHRSTRAFSLGLVVGVAVVALVTSVAPRSRPTTPAPSVVAPSALTLSVAAPSSLTRGTSGTLTVTVGPVGASGTGELVVASRPSTGSSESRVVLDSRGQRVGSRVAVPVVGDVSREYTVSFLPSDRARWVSPAPLSVLVPVPPGTTAPSAAHHSPVRAPAGSPQPTSVATPLGPAVGTGANAVVSAIPDAVWASMVGFSWHPGCPEGRAHLAYVLVNYWGFDGNRHRGELVVARNRAAGFAKAFTELYDAGFPIRSMVRPDRFGHSPNGWPGANDYASMAHDNTYAFNCRFVVGREQAGVLSPHSYGYAVDINTWENPDLARVGARPDAWFLRHRSASFGGVIVPDGLVVRIMRSIGLGWGGRSIGDTQHFDPTLA